VAWRGVHTDTASNCITSARTYVHGRSTQWSLRASLPASPSLSLSPGVALARSLLAAAAPSATASCSQLWWGGQQGSGRARPVVGPHGYPLQLCHRPRLVFSTCLQKSNRSWPKDIIINGSFSFRAPSRKAQMITRNSAACFALRISDNQCGQIAGSAFMHPGKKLESKFRWDNWTFEVLMKDKGMFN
jgi:hypothetical protein